MEALLGLLTGGNGLIAGILAVIALIGGAFLKGRSSGKQDERSKQAAKDAAAVNEAHEIDQEVAAEDPQQKRDELSKWSK